MAPIDTPAPTLPPPADAGMSTPLPAIPEVDSFDPTAPLQLGAQLSALLSPPLAQAAMAPPAAGPQASAGVTQQLLRHAT